MISRPRRVRDILRDRLRGPIAGNAQAEKAFRIIGHTGRAAGVDLAVGRGVAGAVEDGLEEVADVDVVFLQQRG